MARDVKNAAMKNNTTANNISGQELQSAQGLQNTLVPALTAEYSNPAGMGQTAYNAANSAIGQSVGGATSNAMEQGNLEAARTRNAGGFAPAVAEAARQGGRTGAQAGLELTSENENLKQRQRQAALGGLQGLYGTDTQAALNALGLGNQALGAATSADQQTLTSWMEPLKLAVQSGGNLLLGG